MLIRNSLHLSFTIGSVVFLCLLFKSTPLKMLPFRKQSLFTFLRTIQIYIHSTFYQIEIFFQAIEVCSFWPSGRTETMFVSKNLL